MHLKGTHTLPAAREQLWQYLMDPDFLARVTPGVTRLERTGDDTFEAIADIKMGPVKGSFSGDLALREKEEPNSFFLDVSQKSKMGNVSASIKMELTEVDANNTVMSFDGKAKLSGLLARTGQRVLSGVASTLTKQFFAAVEKELAATA
ncbi:MAG: carbon monoxide dehydrogenase subunit G [Bacteroidota bacterium]